MRISAKRALIVGLLVTGAGLASACSTGGTATGDGSATSAAPEPSTSASASEAPEPSAEPAPEEEGGSGSDSGEAAENGSGANCGKVAGTNGKVDVVTVATSAGTVGCTEAINVITEYFADAPDKGQGTAYALTVDGWSCLMDTGTQGSGAVGCDKDGLAFHTQP